ncbi:MAG: hypothetical protein FJ077_14185 [Cyanobacteria bacterium K_DeepCast_35m_m2_023]|nr:hypothetical protein [Cyanobacteria bacterium K_DeepCast_35m_m2_023]
MQRNVLRNRDCALQARDFSGLQWGKITPTDIDAFLDFGDRLYVFVECKFKGASVPYGQYLALTRLADACHCPPKRVSVALIVDHAQAAHEDIDYGSSLVRSYRLNNKWLFPRAPTSTTLAWAIEKLRRYAAARTYTNPLLRETVKAHF